MGWFRGTSADDDDDEAPQSYDERLVHIGPGVPGHCPACDGLGYIDSIDIGHRYQIQHCKDCLHRWEYLFDAEGCVVGITELDDHGNPVTRTRVRPGREVVAEPPPPARRIALPTEAGTHDDELDLRDDAEVLDLTEPEKLSPAAWLRQTIRR